MKKEPCECKGNSFEPRSCVGCGVESGDHDLPESPRVERGRNRTRQTLLARLQQFERQRIESDLYTECGLS